MRKFLTAALALALLGTTPALAQTQRSDNREYRQEQRIDRGAARGHLTPQEMRNLRIQQQRIDRQKARTTRDGYVSPRERQRIREMQNRASRNIERKTNNGRGYY